MRCFVGAGHYFVEGVGYSTIQAILTGGLEPAGAAVLLFAAKLAATSVSLGAGLLGRHFFALAVHGRDHRRRLRRSGQCRPSGGEPRRHHLRHHRHGRDGRRRHRRRHDRRHDDFRDDARLRPGDAEHRRRRARHRRSSAAVAGKHLHHQACRPRPFRAEGAARQHVSGAPRPRGHADGCDDPARRCRLRRVPAPARRTRADSGTWWSRAAITSPASCASTPACGAASKRL